MAHTEEMLIHGIMTPVSVIDSSAQEIDDTVSKVKQGAAGVGAVANPVEIQGVYSDLNSIKTPGFFSCSNGGTTLANVPPGLTSVSFALLVEKTGAFGTGVAQKLIDYYYNKTYTRTTNSASGWTAWKEFATTDNKPKGSYTGNGSAGGRLIKTGGIGNMLLIWSTTGKAFVTPGGGLCSIGTTITNFAANVAKFENCELFIATTDQTMNTNGQTYHYQVL